MNDIMQQIQVIQVWFMVVVTTLQQSKYVNYSETKEIVAEMYSRCEELRDLVEVACLRDVERYKPELELLDKLKEQIDRLDETLEQKWLGI